MRRDSSLVVPEVLSRGDWDRVRVERKSRCNISRHGVVVLLLGLCVLCIRIMNSIETESILPFKEYPRLG